MGGGIDGARYNSGERQREPLRSVSHLERRQVAAQLELPRQQLQPQLPLRPSPQLTIRVS